MQGKIGLVEVEKIPHKSTNTVIEETMFLTQLHVMAATDMYPCEGILTQLIPAPTPSTQSPLALKTGGAMART